MKWSQGLTSCIECGKIRVEYGRGRPRCPRCATKRVRRLRKEKTISAFYERILILLDKLHAFEEKANNQHNVVRHTRTELRQIESELGFWIDNYQAEILQNRKREVA